VACARA